MRAGRRMMVALAVLLCVGAGPAQDNATELVGLFGQSCLRFAGDRQGLRDWAQSIGLHELPPEGEQAFLYGSPGKVFDATNAVGKFVVVSNDDGSCAAIAQRADGAALTADLEQSLRAADIAFTVTEDKDDSAENSLHHRDYAASKDTLRWHILVGTVRDKPGTAMLTAMP